RRPGWFPTGSTDEAAADPGPPLLLPDDESVDPVVARRALRAATVCAVLWLLPVMALVAFLGTGHVLAQEALLFSKAAVVTFGGAYAVLGYVAQQAVGRYAWIGPQDMVTGLGLAETTPGPLIMVVEFVGFLAAYRNPGALPPLAAGALGAVVTVWVTFVPCFLFIFLGAPYVERLRGNRAIGHALTAVSAAVAGVVLSLAVFFALHTAFGTVTERTWGPLHLSVPEWSTVRPASVALSVLAGVLVFVRRTPTLVVLGVSAAAGAVLALAGLT
ncbi:MAG: chromate transporter, partial [Actinomycetes bacterium]